MERGRFITFEGGEGTGKSTQIRLLADSLEAAGVTCVLSREPGGSPGAEEIRRLLVDGAVERWNGLTEVLLNYAGRFEHVKTTLMPALRRGDWALCDRFADSTMAYQGYGHGVDRGLISQLHHLVVGDFAPDLTLVLDLPVEEGLARAAARAGGEDRYERMERVFHDRIRQGFLKIAGRHPERCVLIDAARPVEAVAADVKRVVSERLGVALS